MTSLSAKAVGLISKPDDIHSVVESASKGVSASADLLREFLATVRERADGQAAGAMRLAYLDMISLTASASASSASTVHLDLLLAGIDSLPTELLEEMMHSANK